jgi:hypothetical protein
MRHDCFSDGGGQSFEALIGGLPLLRHCLPWALLPVRGRLHVPTYTSFNQQEMEWKP